MDPVLYEMAVTLRHELHAHPELSNHEVWTKAHLMSFLRTHTRLEVVDRGKWFYAAYRTAPEKPKIAFRADFDALPVEETISLPYGSAIPGVSHKCGHDGHSATLAAFAVEVDRRGAESNVFFIFQHAEETGDGAKECAVLVAEEGIDEVYGYHNEPGRPLGEVIVHRGSFQCASKGMSMYFTGAPSRASDPGLGRNPAFAIARLVGAIPGLYRSEDYAGLVLCTVINIEVGERAFGTSASDGVLRVTIRAQHENEMDRLQARLNTLAYGLAAEYGLEYRAEFCDYFPENVNHDESVERVCRVCEALGIPVHEFEFPKRGSEDFGYFTKAAKGAYFNVGAGNMTAHHTFEYDFPDAIMPVAFDVFRGLAGVR
ncbi:MAG: putative hydrolase YxeP [Firmicutes bacterium ADurb.Bin248]|nr:MAG: putative hydrolase YxeP [Firmicutes bacterium ADurb.Bin248]